MGVLAGASDLLLITKGAVDFIELKLKKGLLVEKETKQSDSQEAFEAGVTRLGHTYTVVRSIEEYIKILDSRGVGVRFRPVESSPSL